MLFVDPGIWPALAALEADLARRSSKEAREARGRLASYRGALGSPGGTGTSPWPLPSGTWTEQPDGRIKIRDPAIQQISRRLRPYVYALTGRVLLDCDWKSAHMGIAAHRSGDAQLLADVRGDIYAATGQAIGIDAAKGSPLRDPTKRSMLALLNGGDAQTIADHFGDVVAPAQAKEIGDVLYRYFWGRYTTLGDFKQAVQEWFWKHPGATFPVHSLTDRVRQIPTASKGDRGWKTLLSALWSGVEAEMLGRVIVTLQSPNPCDVRLEIPLFDGALVSCPEGHEVEAEKLMGWMFEEAARVSGVPGIGVEIKVLGNNWGEKA